MLCGRSYVFRLHCEPAAATSEALSAESGGDGKCPAALSQTQGILPPQAAELDQEPVAVLSLYIEPRDLPRTPGIAEAQGA